MARRARAMRFGAAAQTGVATEPAGWGELDSRRFAA